MSVLHHGGSSPELSPPTLQDPQPYYTAQMHLDPTPCVEKNMLNGISNQFIQQEVYHNNTIIYFLESKLM